MILIELNAGDLRLLLRPDLGGSVAGLWRAGVPVLRSAADGDIAGPRQSGGFPLVPYSGRLGQRRFRWAGRDHTTAANFDHSPHSLHGVGWRRAWQVDASGPDSAQLSLRHQPDDDWPFAFDVRQRFQLSPVGLRLELEATNRHAEPQPLGLGWHPYFMRRSRSRLHLEATHRWDRDELLLPSHRVASTGIDGDVAPMDWDHPFEGWTGPARLRDEKLSMRMSSSLDRVVVYTPRERDFYCVEPVSHNPNAIQADDPATQGLAAVAPGAAVSAWIQLDIAAA
ncbi:MAG: aldose 1-epimerase [Aquabacterium sp.]